MLSDKGCRNLGTKRVRTEAVLIVALTAYYLVRRSCFEKGEPDPGTKA